MSRITNLKSYLFILNKNGVRNYYFKIVSAILKKIGTILVSDLSQKETIHVGLL